MIGRLITVNAELRLRQICLLAHDLEWTSGVLSAAFDAPVVFRDPRMAAGGNLTNTHIRLGDSFLERLVLLIVLGQIRPLKLDCSNKMGTVVTWQLFRYLT